MKRMLINFCSAVSLLLCILTGAGWIWTSRSVIGAVWVASGCTCLADPPTVPIGSRLGGYDGAQQESGVARLNGPAGRFVSFTRDGKLLLAGDETSVRVWSTTTFRPVSEVIRHGGRLTWAGFNPQGTLVVTAGQGRAQFWNAETGKTIGEPLLHNEKNPALPLRATFSPDGKRLLTFGADAFVKVWDAERRTLVDTLQHRSRLRSAAFSPDGKTLATALNGMVYLRDAAAGKVRAEAIFNPGEPRDCEEPLAFSADGSRLAVAEYTGFIVLNGQTGELAAHNGQFKPRGLDGLGAVNMIAFSPDGKQVLLVSNIEVSIWDAATGRPVIKDRFLRPDGFAAFSPDGKSILCRGRDEFATGIWNLATHARELEFGLSSYGFSVATFSPDGKLVATGYNPGGNSSRTVLWRIGRVDPDK